MSRVKSFYHDEILAREAEMDGIFPCENCNGTGAIDAAWSGSDPCCPQCGGEGLLYETPKAYTDYHCIPDEMPNALTGKRMAKKDIIK
tara:strand:- start:129 stop:392 length:264 start_codon:yes stop_codon:yes gene_type:complete